MKLYHFKLGAREYGNEYLVTAASREDAFADLENHLMEFDCDDPSSYWKNNPNLVSEFEIGQVVTTEVC